MQRGNPFTLKIIIIKKEERCSKSANKKQKMKMYIVYTYIYIHIHIYNLYIYTYIYTFSEGEEKKTKKVKRKREKRDRERKKDEITDATNRCTIFGFVYTNTLSCSLSIPPSLVKMSSSAFSFSSYFPSTHTPSHHHLSRTFLLCCVSQLSPTVVDT